MEGRIIKNISNQYTVYAGGINYLCNARGKFRNLKQTPLVGDFVEFDEKQNYINKILSRKNSLVRPPICNVDITLVVTSTHIPSFSSNLLDKQLCIIEYNNIKPIICFTKMDLLSNDEKEEINKYIAYYKKIGYDVFVNSRVNDIKSLLKEKVTVLTGQTGAGKSTLLNNIDKSLNLKTGEVSIALGRGKHTTRHVELLKFDEGWIADTPGFSSLDFIDMTKEDIRDNFIEFNNYRHECRYKDCMHDLEDHCNIKLQVENGNIMRSRYENYLNFIRKV